MEVLERLRKPLLHPTDLRGHLIFHSLGVGPFASVSIDKVSETFPQLIAHQRAIFNLILIKQHKVNLPFQTFYMVGQFRL